MRSIRWRLPLSYAGIALLVALSLGAVLLTLLRGYYARQEVDYLRGNARAIVAVLGKMLESELPPDALQMQLQVYALLSQSRLQVLDVQGQPLAEADAPNSTRLVSVIRKSGDSGEVVAVAGPAGDVVVRARGIEPPGDADPAGAGGEGQVARGPMLYLTLDRHAEGEQPVGAAPPDEARMALSLPPDFVSSIPAVGTRLGIGFDPQAAWGGRRSDQVVRAPIAGDDGRPLGTLELSDGPAYGLEIVDSVARGWAVAGGVAVALAALVGWWVSRTMSRPLLALTTVTTRMAGGDLAARVAMARDDEFGQLAGSYNRMADRVQETVCALQRFVADAAHELNTPLTALRTNLELVAADGEDAARAAHLLRAQQQVDRLQALAGDLLDLSRIDATVAGAEPAAHARLDLTSLVRGEAEAHASRAEQAEIDLRMHLPDGPRWITGDAAQLARAVGNLLDNALKFAPSGGRVEVGLADEPGAAIVWVRDTGIGIPDDEFPRLFGRFHRGRNAAAYPGSGLGLAIVKAVADAHGGAVAAVNMSVGVCFRLRLGLDGPPRNRWQK